jgi:hypothetical protein
MDTISALSPSFTASDVTDAISFDRIGDVFESVTPDLADVADAASSVARQGRRLGIRTITTSVRVVRKHPRGVAAVVASLIALTALAIFLKNRGNTPELELAEAA